MIKFKTSAEFAILMDEKDELKSFRNAFYFPVDNDGNKLFYFTGNSLGLQPKTTRIAIKQELDDWANLGVEGHFKAKNPWMPYHESLSRDMAKIVGAKPNIVSRVHPSTINS